MKSGYIVEIVTGNTGKELQNHINNFILSGIAEDIDEITYYLNMAYIEYKPKEGVTKSKLFKYVLGEKSGVVLGTNAEEVKHMLDTFGVRNASITELMDVIVADSNPRII